MKCNHWNQHNNNNGIVKITVGCLVCPIYWIDSLCNSHRFERNAQFIYFVSANEYHNHFIYALIFIIVVIIIIIAIILISKSHNHRNRGVYFIINRLTLARIYVLFSVKTLSTIM